MLRKPFVPLHEMTTFALSYRTDIMQKGNSKYLFVTPPFTQLNTSYPAISYLTGFMRRQGIDAEQTDLSLETFLAIFSKQGLASVADILESYTDLNVPEALAFLQNKKQYIQKVDSVIRFLQAKDQTLADRIVSRAYLPEGSRFAQAEDLDWAFGTMGTINHAKHLCTLFLEDIGDVISKTIDPDFAFSRYAESIGREAHEFDEIDSTLALGYSFTAEICIDKLAEKLKQYQPTIVCISVPFPGNLLLGLQCAKYIKETHPEITVCMGGGFPNTELRNLTDTRIFKYVDFITLDDGELPLLQIHKYLNGNASVDELVRTYYMDNETLVYADAKIAEFDHTQTGWPDYSGLPLDKYLSFIEVVNPMHRLWSDGRWNKMTLAHGCYWHKCTFCDTTLDYIKRYSQTDASTLCDRIEEIIEQTKTTGFHFVDEAAPPAVLRELALEILRRGITISWWTNIRFDKAFTADLCRLLSLSGCIAVTGGLEVASDRVLQLIKKNVNLEQATKVAYYFTENGIMVHTYLMYGFPTQTEQETVDSLEVVRQLMENGLVQSAFWHKFTLTRHSPVAQDPDAYKIKILNAELSPFANNDLEHVDETGAHHDKFSEGLTKALYNYLHGICFDTPAHKWFSRNTKPSSVSPFFITNILSEAEMVPMPPLNRTLYYLGAEPVFLEATNKAGKKKIKIIVQLQNGEEATSVPEPIGWWLELMLPKLGLEGEKCNMSSFQQSYIDAGLVNFPRFVYSPAFDLLCKAGLVIV